MRVPDSEIPGEAAAWETFDKRDPLDLVRELRDRREAFALATVIETHGSVSAPVGSKAVLASDGHILAGWVGGGCAAGAVGYSAIEALESGAGRILDLDLNAEALGAGMPCGGTMRVFVEPFRPRPRLWVLGHGLVAETLCAMGAMVGFDVAVDDPLADRAHFPAASVLLSDDDAEYSMLDVRDGDYVVVATQHKGDHQSIARCLRAKVAAIALIASNKRARLVIDYLRGEGFGEDVLARLYAPAGLDLGARAPEEIALSVMSQVVLLRHGASGAARRLAPAVADLA